MCLRFAPLIVALFVTGCGSDGSPSDPGGSDTGTSSGDRDGGGAADGTVSTTDGARPDPMCGDGVCDASEVGSCPTDCSVPPASELEGFGAQAEGADGCPTPETYRVTTLDDGGEGSFRDAVSVGCRHVVFDVGGTITLTDDLDIEVSNLTIDGSTAPAPGITIHHPPFYALVIKAGDADVHDVVVRYLRHTGPGGHDESTQDFWGFEARDTFVIHDVVLDHLTMTGSNDGIFDFAGVTDRTAYSNITISWSFIHTQARATSVRGVRGISYHHNVLARNDDRQPKMTGDTEADYVNNVTYAWGHVCHRSTVAGLSLDSDEAVDPRVIATNNVFHDIETTCGSNPDQALWYQNGEGESELYTDGNIFPAEEDERGNVGAPPFEVPDWARVTTHPADTLGDRVVSCAGTVYPTAEERALLDEIAVAIGGAGGACAAM